VQVDLLHIHVADTIVLMQVEHQVLDHFMPVEEEAEISIHGIFGVRAHQIGQIIVQIVYLMSKDLQKTNAGIETLYAYHYILNNIKNLNLTANFISQKDINYIENMESEKYRKNLTK
jgi:hypothetical protein